jgi:predicted CXXCH cytochrome family protein
MEEQVMKKSVMLVLCILMGMLVVASIAVAGTAAGTGIKAGPHDLSLTGGNGASVVGDGTEQGGKDRICVYCHAPHNTIKNNSAAANGIKYLPLWNHTVTTQQYAMYSNGTEVPNDINHQSQAMVELAGKQYPGGVSRLCLSCHDGTVSTNAYGATSSSKGADNKNISTAGAQYIIGGGGDLTNHHPIGFSYANVHANDDEINADTTIVKAGMTIASLLWNGNVECTTCHDVHNTKNDGEKFLWASDANSAFCLKCHNKDKAGVH